MPVEPVNANDEKIRDALRTLAQFCAAQGYDSFRWVLRNGPHDPDGGVTDWHIVVRPAATTSARLTS